MDQVPKPEKPYRFDTIPKPVNLTDFAMWEATLWDYLRSIKRNRKLLRKNLTWTLDEDTRGFVDDDEGPEASRLSGEDKAEILESILLKIGTYGPKSIFIDITKRSTGYKYIFDAIKRVCGFPVPGAQLIHYMCDPDAGRGYHSHDGEYSGYRLVRSDWWYKTGQIHWTGICKITGEDVDFRLTGNNWTAGNDEIDTR